MAKKVVFGAGIWDMLHKGHLELLRLMRKEAGDGKLIILTHDDKSCYEIKDKFPVQDLEHRIKNLELTEIPDEVFYTDEADPASLFEKLITRYSYSDKVYMRGDDLTEDFPGRWMLDKHDIPIKFKKYTKEVSSSKIRDSL